MDLGIKNIGKERVIVEEPDPRLHQQSARVKAVDQEIQQLMEDMVATMKINGGIGLAAVQVGAMYNVLVVDVANICESDEESRRSAPSVTYLCMANTEVVAASEETCEMEEGCLSVPGIQAVVTRPNWVSFEYLDYHNNPAEITVHGLLARCILHEMDHIKGRIIIDYLSPLRKDMALKKLVKRKRILAQNAKLHVAGANN